MAGTSKKRKMTTAKNSADFKRIKAKVGKRAVKSANVTDTNFKSVSVSVKNQNQAVQSTTASVDDDNNTRGGNGKLVSDRGRSIDDLVTQLNHPASAVRTSAIRGISNIIDRCSHCHCHNSSSDDDEDGRHRLSLSLMKTHLSVLLPAMAKCCCIDEDQDVRQLGLMALRTILTITTSSSRSRRRRRNNHDGNDSTTTCTTAPPSTSSPPTLTAIGGISPFMMTLLVAYVNSAVNSLDRSVRYDGCRTIVEILCSCNTTTTTTTAATLPLPSSTSSSSHNNIMVGSSSSQAATATTTTVLLRQLLPAYVQLLSDYMATKHKRRQRRRPHSSNKPAAADTDSTTTTETLKKRRSRRKNGGYDVRQQHGGGQFVILESLVALLRTMLPEAGGNRRRTIVDNSKQSLASRKPDCVFVPGGRTANGLLVVSSGHERVQHRSSVVAPPLQSIDQLGSFMNGEETLDDGPLSSGKETNQLSIGVVMDIASKLRDVFIELTQRSSNSQGPRGTMLLLGTADMEELALLNEAIRLLWNAICRRDVIRCRASNNGTKQQVEVEGLRRVFTTLLSLIVESFPVWQEQSSSTSVMEETRCALLNAEMCSTLMDIGGCLEADSKTQTDWTKKVLGYFLPRLESDMSIPIQGETIIEVLSGLYFLTTNDELGFTLIDKTRYKLLDRLCSVFFAEVNAPDFARLASSRRAALLIVSVLEQEYFLAATKSPVCTHLMAAIKVLPSYLHAWRGDFLEESGRVLCALHDVSRRLDLENQSAKDVVECLQNSLAAIFDAPKRSKRKRSESRPSSIFELYPEYMQRVALGLLVMIRSPNETIMNGLSDVCARSGSMEGTVSPMIADAVMNAAHSIRRSMSMQTYLSFIIRSIGIANFDENLTTKRDNKSSKKSSAPPNDGNDDGPSQASRSLAEGTDRDDREEPSTGTDIRFEMVRTSEAAVRRAVQSFALCGSAKVLPMIDLVLSDWLAAMSPTSGLVPSQKAIRFRTATSIYAMLLLDMMSSSATSAVPENILSLVAMAPDLVRSLVNATCNLFAFCFSEGSNNRVSIDDFDYLMQPVLALMKTDAVLVEKTIEQASRLICDKEADSTEASAYMEALLLIVRNAELAVMLRNIPKALARCIETIESAASASSNNTLDRQARTFRTTVELLIGKLEQK